MPEDNPPAPLRRVLRARYVFPVIGPPVPDGVVTIQRDTIVGVGDVADSAPVDDLGNVAIIPGLVNAHTHLEFSDLQAPLGEPGLGMVDWVRRVIAHRRETALLPGHSTESGLHESSRSGTTALAEIAQPGWPREAFVRAPMRATVFLELIAPTAERVGAARELAAEHLRSPDEPSGCLHLGLSPHAPYSVHPSLLRRAIDLSASHCVPLSFHLAESREELELLRTGGGPFEELLQEINAWDPTTLPPATRPLDYLRMLAEADRTLIIHGNYLDDEEIAFLASHAPRMGVVYCPRTHVWFRHKPYPLEKMLAAGAMVALGTDSRASSPDLNILAEMRKVAEQHAAVPGSVILQLGTLGGARILGHQRESGSLTPGKRADLVVVALPDREAADPHELLLQSDQPVVAVYYGGARL